MANRSDITPELCRQLLRYEPETGRIYRLPRPREFFASERAYQIFKVRFEGKEAFTSINRAHRYGHFMGVMFLAHRIAFAIMEGRWPSDQIDHINGNGLDNRWSNLREATAAINLRNIRIRTDNTSGVHGVSWDRARKRWHAYINFGGKRIHVGRFQNFEDAIEARKDAEKGFDFHPNHGRHAALPRRTQ